MDRLDALKAIVKEKADRLAAARKQADDVCDHRLVFLFVGEACLLLSVQTLKRREQYLTYGIIELIPVLSSIPVIPFEVLLSTMQCVKNRIFCTFAVLPIFCCTLQK